MRRKHLKIALLSTFVLSLAFSSCVDDSYDLNKDIDMNMNLGGDHLGIKIGSTDPIMLDEIIKVEDSELLKTDSEGNYSLEKQGDGIDPVTVEINSVTVDAPSNIDAINVPLVFTIPSDLPSSAKKRAFVLPADVISIPLPDTYSTSFKLENNDIPKEIKSINTLDVSMNITIKFSVPGMEDATKALYFDNFVVQFPKYIVSSKLNDKNQLILNDESAVEKGKHFEVTIPITKVDFSEGKIPDGEGLQYGEGSDPSKLLLNGGVSVSGSVYVLKIDLIDHTPGKEIDLTLVTEVEMSNMTVNSVVGKFDPNVTIDNIKPIVLNGLPDFLQDENVRLDVENPMIFVTVTNEVPIPVTIEGILRSVKGLDDRTVEIGKGNEKITIDAAPEVGGSTTTVICLSRQGVGAPEGGKNITVANINDLIERIPDEITMDLTADANDGEEHIITLGRDYTVVIDYRIDIPLAFGANLQIVYNDTIDGIKEDLEDFDFKKAVVKATTENSIPLALNLNVKPVDIDKKIIEDLDVKIEGTIASCSENGDIVDSNVIITVTEKVENSGILKKMDGLIINVTADPGQAVGKRLNKNQFFRFKDMKLTVPGGVNVNLN